MHFIQKSHIIILKFQFLMFDICAVVSRFTLYSLCNVQTITRPGLSFTCYTLLQSTVSSKICCVIVHRSHPLVENVSLLLVFNILTSVIRGKLKSLNFRHPDNVYKVVLISWWSREPKTVLSVLSVVDYVILTTDFPTELQYCGCLATASVVAAMLLLTRNMHRVQLDVHYSCLVPTPPGKLLRVLEFFPLFKGPGKFWKSMYVLEISGNLMSRSWKVLEFALFQI